MNTRTRPLILASMLLLPALAISSDDRKDGGQGTFDFRSHLSGAQEVTPPAAPATPSLGVNTETSGKVLVRVSKDLSSLQFNLVVRNIASLTAAAFEGLVYANVHTVENPAGEVRGQLIPTSSDKADDRSDKH